MFDKIYIFLNILYFEVMYYFYYKFREFETYYIFIKNNIKLHHRYIAFYLVLE